MLDLKIMYNTIRVVFSPSASEGVLDKDKDDSDYNSLNVLKDKGYALKEKDTNCLAVVKIDQK